ncbi:MAG: hypothetical protein M3O84_00410 [Actinomycetota bacterium]|nr:hypothetical protein [Actinomycetota bacterium]
MEKTQVWAVRLSGVQREVKGSIHLEEGSLLFHAADGSPGDRIPATDLRRVRRVRGSPVLVIHYVTASGDATAAFYFTKPPPVEPPEGVRKRKARRQAIHYLEMSNMNKKEQVKEWHRALKEAMRTAQDGSKR